ncbi:MAG: hypothetical protein H0T76_22440 [Nannocystis sp.]|nr:hypothetical protein [Nannocystis sp.]
MVIAAVKSAVVAIFFMHLAHESRLILIMVIGSILLLATLVGFVFLDFFNRPTSHAPRMHPGRGRRRLTATCASWRAGPRARCPCRRARG